MYQHVCMSQSSEHQSCVQHNTYAQQHNTYAQQHTTSVVTTQMVPVPDGAGARRCRCQAVPVPDGAGAGARRCRCRCQAVPVPGGAGAGARRCRCRCQAVPLDLAKFAKSLLFEHLKSSHVRFAQHD